MSAEARAEGLATSGAPLLLTFCSGFGCKAIAVSFDALGAPGDFLQVRVDAQPIEWVAGELNGALFVVSGKLCTFTAWANLNRLTRDIARSTISSRSTF